MVHTSTGKAPFEIVEERPKGPPILIMKGDIITADKKVKNIKIRESSLLLTRLRVGIQVMTPQTSLVTHIHTLCLGAREP